MPVSLSGDVTNGSGAFAGASDQRSGFYVWRCMEDDADMHLILDFGKRKGNTIADTGLATTTHIPIDHYRADVYNLNDDDTTINDVADLTESWRGRASQWAADFDANIAQLDFDNYTTEDMLKLESTESGQQEALTRTGDGDAGCGQNPLRHFALLTEPPPPPIGKLNLRNSITGVNRLAWSHQREFLRNSLELSLSRSHSLFSSSTESCLVDQNLTSSLHHGTVGAPGDGLFNGSDGNVCEDGPFISTDSLDLSLIRDGCLTNKNEYQLTFDYRLGASVISTSTANAVSVGIPDLSSGAVIPETGKSRQDDDHEGSQPVSGNVDPKDDPTEPGLMDSVVRSGDQSGVTSSNSFTTWGRVRRSYEIERAQTPMQCSRFTSLPNLLSRPGSTVMGDAGGERLASGVTSADEERGDGAHTVPELKQSASSEEGSEGDGDNVPGGDNVDQKPQRAFSADIGSGREGRTSAERISLFNLFRSKFPVKYPEGQDEPHQLATNMIDDSDCSSGYLTGDTFIRTESTASGWGHRDSRHSADNIIGAFRGLPKWLTDPEDLSLPCRPVGLHGRTASIPAYSLHDPGNAESACEKGPDNSLPECGTKQNFEPDQKYTVSKTRSASDAEVVNAGTGDWKYSEFYANGKYIDVNHNEIGYVPPLSSRAFRSIDASDFAAYHSNGKLIQRVQTVSTGTNPIPDDHSHADSFVNQLPTTVLGTVDVPNLNLTSLSVEKPDKPRDRMSPPDKPPRTFSLFGSDEADGSAGFTFTRARSLRRSGRQASCPSGRSTVKDSATQIPIYVVNQSVQTTSWDNGHLVTVVTTSVVQPLATSKPIFVSRTVHISPPTSPTKSHFATFGNLNTSQRNSSQPSSSGAYNRPFQGRSAPPPVAPWFDGNYDIGFTPRRPPRPRKFKLPDLGFMKLPFSVPPLFPAMPKFPLGFCSSGPALELQADYGREQYLGPTSASSVTAAGVRGKPPSGVPWLDQPLNFGPELGLGVPDPPKLGNPGLSKGHHPILSLDHSSRLSSNVASDVPVASDSGLGKSSGPSHVQDWDSLSLLLPKEVVQTCSFFKTNRNLLHSTTGDSTTTSLSIDKPLSSTGMSPRYNTSAAAVQNQGPVKNLYRKKSDNKTSAQNAVPLPVSDPVSTSRLRRNSSFEPIVEEVAGAAPDSCETGVSCKDSRSSAHSFGGKLIPAEDQPRGTGRDGCCKSPYHINGRDFCGHAQDMRMGRRATSCGGQLPHSVGNITSWCHGYSSAPDSTSVRSLFSGSDDFSQSMQKGSTLPRSRPTVLSTTASNGSRFGLHPSIGADDGSYCCHGHFCEKAVGNDCRQPCCGVASGHGFEPHYGNAHPISSYYSQHQSNRVCPANFSSTASEPFCNHDRHPVAASTNHNLRRASGIDRLISNGSSSGKGFLSDGNTDDLRNPPVLEFPRRRFHSDNLAASSGLPRTTSYHPSNGELGRGLLLNNFYRNRQDQDRPAFIKLDESDEFNDSEDSLSDSEASIGGAYRQEITSEYQLRDEETELLASPDPRRISSVPNIRAKGDAANSFLPSKSIRGCEVDDTESDEAESPGLYIPRPRIRHWRSSDQTLSPKKPLRSFPKPGIGRTQSFNPELLYPVFKPCATCFRLRPHQRHRYLLNPAGVNPTIRDFADEIYIDEDDDDDGDDRYCDCETSEVFDEAAQLHQRRAEIHQRGLHSLAGMDSRYSSLSHKGANGQTGADFAYRKYNDRYHNRRRFAPEYSSRAMAGSSAGSDVLHKKLVKAKRALVAEVVNECDRLLSKYGPIRADKPDHREIHILVGHSHWGLCGAIRSLISDGLLESFSVWHVVLASATLGPATKCVYDLVAQLIDEKRPGDPSQADLPAKERMDLRQHHRAIPACEDSDADEERFDGFVRGLLRLNALDCWLSYLVLKDKLLLEHYSEVAFMRLAPRKQIKAMFTELIMAIQPLAIIPFSSFLPVRWEHQGDNCVKPDLAGAGDDHQQDRDDGCHDERWSKDQPTLQRSTSLAANQDLVCDLATIGADYIGKSKTSYQRKASLESPQGFALVQSRLHSDSRVPKSSSIPSRLSGTLRRKSSGGMTLQKPSPVSPSVLAPGANGTVGATLAHPATDNVLSTAVRSTARMQNEARPCSKLEELQQEPSRRPPGGLSKIPTPSSSRSSGIPRPQCPNRSSAVNCGRPYPANGSNLSSPSSQRHPSPQATVAGSPVSRIPTPSSALSPLSRRPAALAQKTMSPEALKGRLPSKAGARTGSVMATVQKADVAEQPASAVSSKPSGKQRRAKVVQPSGESDDRGQFQNRLCPEDEDLDRLLNREGVEEEEETIEALIDRLNLSTNIGITEIEDATLDLFSSDDDTPAHYGNSPRRFVSPATTTTGLAARKDDDPSPGKIRTGVDVNDVTLLIGEHERRRPPMHLRN